MEVKLDSLIEKIRKEGIEEAQHTSEKMLKDAQAKASSIIEEAKKEAEKIKTNAKQKADQFKMNAESDIQQAARNTELLLKEKVDALFDNVFKHEVGEKLKPEFLKELIMSIVNAWVKNSDVEVIVGESDKKQLESLLFSGLKGKLKESISLRVSKDISKGFRIGLKNDQVYYDFSDDSIAEVLKSLLNPRLKEILDK